MGQLKIEHKYNYSLYFRIIIRTLSGQVFPPHRPHQDVVLCHVFSYESSNGLPERLQNRTGCICLVSLRCVFSNVSSNCLPERIHSHIGCICLPCPHFVFSNVSSNCLLEKRQIHTGCICLTFLHCVVSSVSLAGIFTLVTFVWLFSAVYFQMYPQMAC